MEVIGKVEAKASSLNLYFTGKPCARGEVSARRVSDGACICNKCTDHRRASKAARYEQNAEKNRETAKEVARQKRTNHRDAWLEEKRKYREANRDKLLAKQRASRAGDVDAHRERRRKYAKQNPDVERASCARYRARKSSASPGWNKEFDNFVMLEAVDLCRMRGNSTGFDWHVDHMIPLLAENACGLHVGINLQVIPASMNMSKKNRMIYVEPGDWLK